MKDGAILANSGHFNVEIDVEVLSLLQNQSEPSGKIIGNIISITDVSML